MFAVLAGVVFIVAAVLGITDRNMEIGHLMALGYVGLALIAAHLAARLYAPDRRW